MMQRMGAASGAFETPGAQCPGVQEIEWSYLPYAVSADDDAPFLRLAHGFLYPPAAHAVRRMACDMTGDMDFVGAGIRWNGNNIVFSTLKPAHDGEGYILRLYENQGIQTATDINIGCFKNAWLARMDETPLDEIALTNGAVHAVFGPYKTMTLLLK